MVIVLVRCTNVFCQEISVKDIYTSLVVQRALDKKKTCDSINLGRYNDTQALWYDISFRLSHGYDFQ